MGTLLRVEQLGVTFDLPEGKVRAVDGVSFSIEAGSIVALAGESGSGKSVVSQAIMGILPPTARITGGNIWLDDPQLGTEPIDLAALPPAGRIMRSLRGDRISIIFQEPMSSLSPLHTIGDQIGEALRVHKNMSQAQARALVKEMLGHIGFPRPTGAYAIYPYQLSGGLRQRVMIAMALICRPGLLIADEPTTALDVTVQAQILRLIKNLQSELAMAVLFITHDLGVVANLAQEMVVVYRGRVMEAGSVQALFSRPEHPYLKALFRAVPRSNMKPDERLTPLRQITVANSESPPLKPAQGKQLPLLEVRGLTKRFLIPGQGWLRGKNKAFLHAVSAVNFDIRRGECLGLVGESGSGKSTVCKLLLRALHADEGEVIWNQGQERLDVFSLSTKALLEHRRRVQYVFQDPFHSLNPRMTVADIIGEPLRIHGLGDRRERLEQVFSLLGLVGLETRHATRYPHSFSGGQRQRIGIARALALRPELLICDEPVSALDVSVQAQVLNLLKDLQKHLGLTMLFVSHNLAVVHYMAHRVAVMCAGHVVELAPRKDLFARPQHPYTQLLLSAIPEPDLHQQLDFAAIAEEKMSDPGQWPQPFRLEPGVPSVMKEVGTEHQIRVGA